ncbi:hypothetical protein [Streptomyces sp. NBC_00056]|uniref:hypothetical protein n=1 Tax=Streptomyces sp. NBC_00056 TaxID=2975633 RepID=UPI003D8010CE
MCILAISAVFPIVHRGGVKVQLTGHPLGGAVIRVLAFLMLGGTVAWLILGNVSFAGL